MGKALDRSWLSQFDNDYYRYEDNRERYKGITPDHANEKWKVDLWVGKKRLSRNVATLTEAQEAVNTFRQSAGEG